MKKKILSSAVAKNDKLPEINQVPKREVSCLVFL